MDLKSYSITQLMVVRIMNIHANNPYSAETNAEGTEIY